MDYSTTIFVCIYAVVIAGLVGVSFLAAIQRLVLPVLDSPAFTIKGLLLDGLGAVILLSGGYDLLGIVFGSTGWIGLLEMIAIYTLASLGLFGILIVVMISLAIRFCLRLAMLLTPKRAHL